MDHLHFETTYFYCYDGDRIGESIQKFILSDNLAAAQDFSDKVLQATNHIKKIMCGLGAKPVFEGGDSLIFIAPREIEESRLPLGFEEITFSLGIGISLPDAAVGLFRAKSLGRACIMWGMR